PSAPTRCWSKPTISTSVWKQCSTCFANGTKPFTPIPANEISISLFGGSGRGYSGLSRRFGSRTVLNDLSMYVPRGSVFGLVGENGAGKTTLIKHLLGLLRAQKGEVRVFGLPGLQPGRGPRADRLPVRTTRFAGLDAGGRIVAVYTGLLPAMGRGL